MWRKLLPLCIFGVLQIHGAGAQQVAHDAADGFAHAMTNRNTDSAARRTALVIGNASYSSDAADSLPAVPNAVHDAQSVAKTLRAQGFDVVLRTDATAQQMREALADFGRRLQPGGTALFYFAGHALQAGQATLLTSMGADPRAPATLLNASVDLSDVLATLSMPRAGARNLIVLDACLTQPFAPTFVAVALPPQTLMAYATAPGSTAADGIRHGLFTSAWLREMARAPGQSVDAMFAHVNERVRADTHGMQQPWTVSSLTSPVRLADAGGFATPLAAQATDHVVTMTSRGILPKDSNEQYELTFWESVKDSNYASDYEAYLKAYPNGRFAALAKARIERLKGAASAAPPATFLNSGS